MKILARFALFALLAALVVPALPVSARPVVAEDLFKLKLLSNAQIAPDGVYAVAVETHLNGPKNSYESTILLVNVATGATRDATHGTHDGGMAWMPDSRGFAFTRPAKKGHKPQIFTYRLSDGKIVQITHLKDGAGGAQYSHDGKRIAFTVNSTDPAHATYVDFAKAGFTPKKAQKLTDVRTIEQMHFEANGAGYVYGDHAHIWTMNSDGSNARALTSGQWTENFDGWSPDDRTIAFDSLRYDSPSLGPGDVYTIPSAGGAMRELHSGELSNGGFYGNTGNRVWLFSGGIEDPAAYPALVSANADGSERRTLVSKDVYSWGDGLLADLKEGGGLCGPLFDPQDRWFVTNVDGPGYSNLRRFDARSGAVTNLTPAQGEAWSCTISRDGTRVAFLYSDFTHPADLYVVNTAGGAPRRVTGVNDAFVKTLTLSVPQPFSVTDADGVAIRAWFMPAIGAKSGEKRATLLDIHGGPATEFGDTFFHELQMWASQGYNVVFSDPRGSVGFGYDSQEALVKNFGTVMFDDVQAVMDAAVRRPDVDSSRLGVLGGSYGGYATLWIIAHTDRYKTAIAERVVSNLATEQLAADLASDNALGGKYSWGLPWQAGSKYLEQSPVSFVGSVHTPLLILHSSEDTRTPIDQTLQEFNALKILGRTVRYIEVPGENHDLSRTGSPIHRVERLNILSQWLRSYLHP